MHPHRLASSQWLPPSGWLWALALSLAAQVLGLAGADTTGLLSEGQPFATPYYVRDSGVPGPSVAIIGGIHGDEAAGAAAADQVRHWPIARGKLVVVPRANTLALAANQRLTPHEPSATANLNRNFPRPGPAEAARGELAQALWALLREHRPDWVIDLHEGTDYRSTGSKSVGSSLIVFPTAAGRIAATQMLAAVNATITNRERAYVLLKMPVAGSLVRAAGEHLRANAMIIESTRGQPLSRRTRQQRTLAHSLLRQLGMVDDRVTPAWLMPQPRLPGQIRVGVYDAEGTSGQGVPRVLEQLARETNVVAACIGPEDIADGALGQFEVIAFTGGSGSGQGTALGPAAAAQVRQFVAGGGGYLGICAGAFLACHGFSWGLNILDAKTVSPLWRRGSGAVQVELTAKGCELFEVLPPVQDCRYVNGPIIQPAQVGAVPDFEVWAVFRSELAANNTPKGIMIHSPAIVAGRYGRGRVLCASPHPEQTKGWESFVPRAVNWLAGNETTKKPGR